MFYLNIIVKKFFSFTCTKNHIINIQIYFFMRVATQIALSKAFCKIAWRTRSYAVVVIWIWALSVYIKQGEIHLGKRNSIKGKKNFWFRFSCLRSIKSYSCLSHYVYSIYCKSARHLVHCRFIALKLLVSLAIIISFYLMWNRIRIIACLSKAILAN